MVSKDQILKVLAALKERLVHRVQEVLQEFLANVDHREHLATVDRQEDQAKEDHQGSLGSRDPLDYLD